MYLENGFECKYVINLEGEIIKYANYFELNFNEE